MLISNIDSISKNQINGIYYDHDHSEEFKFHLDSCQILNGEFLLYLNGIIFNRIELLKTDTKTYFSNYKYIDYELIQKFRGSYNFIHGSSKKIVAISDQFGSKPIFYYYKNGYYAVSNDFYELNKLLNKIRQPVLDSQSAYQMLTYGFMLGDNTIIEDIKTVPEGSISVFNIASSKLVIKKYHTFKFVHSNNTNIKSHLEKTNKLFEIAVNEMIEKDKEHGFNHLVTMSGGLDSRLVNAYVKSLGVENVLNFTIGQSSSLDVLYASKTTNHLKFSKLVRLLDDGLSLLSYKSVVENNFGLVLYSGQSHMYHGLKSVNFKQYGIIHSGQLGDVIFGNFYDYRKNRPLHVGYHSSKLLDKIELIDTKNTQEFLYETRGFKGVIRSHLALNEYSELWSPFLNLNLLEYCLSIPPHIKHDHKFYKEFYKRYHFKIGKIGSDRYFGANIFSNKIVIKLFKLRYLGFKKTFIWIGFKLKVIKKFPQNILKKSMNPFNYWVKENPNIETNLINEINESLEALKKHLGLEIYNDILNLKKNSNVTEKTMIITLLESMKNLFDINIKYK